MRRFLCLFLSLSGLLLAEETKQETISSEEVSFYRGYLLWQEYLKKPGIQYDLEEVMKGMMAAEKEIPLPDENAMLEKIFIFQKVLYEKQKTDNLAAAERYLKTIATEKNIQEVVPNKLYYKIVSHGSGKRVDADSTPTVSYTLFTFPNGEEEEMITMDPHPIILADILPGVAQGVIGMQEGEARVLYIHPDLAYGTYGKAEPNTLLIAQITLVKVDKVK